MSLLKPDKFSKKGPCWLSANKETNQKLNKKNFFVGSDKKNKDIKLLSTLQVKSTNIIAKID